MSVRLYEIVWCVFVKITKLQSIFLNNHKTYVKVLFQSIKQKTQKAQKDEKLVFQNNM